MLISSIQKAKPLKGSTEKCLRFDSKVEIGIKATSQHSWEKLSAIKQKRTQLSNWQIVKTVIGQQKLNENR